MIGLFFGSLLLIVLGIGALFFSLKMRALGFAGADNSFSLIADRYRPMLRLLSEEDFAYVGGNPTLERKLRARRRELFRAYLACLTRDYARLLGGLRHVIVQSGTDRPDLARAIARNRMLFAWFICKIELRLMVHATGVGTIDISNLVDAVEVLRSQVLVLSAASVPAQ